MSSFSDTMTALADGIRAAPEDLAAQTGCTADHVTRLLAGISRPSEALAARLDEILSGGGLLAAAAAEDLAGAQPTAALAAACSGPGVPPHAVGELSRAAGTLAARYAADNPAVLCAAARGWLAQAAALLGSGPQLRQHRDILAAAGWLALLAGCTEYDGGHAAAAEETRLMALQLGREAGDPEVIGWGWEMLAWFGWTSGNLPGCAAAAEAGLAVAGQRPVGVQLHAHLARARAAAGDRNAMTAELDAAAVLLAALPPPGDPASHFAIDPGKISFYAMDCHLLLRDYQGARRLARAILASPGTGPMRAAEARLALAAVAARRRDVIAAAALTAEALAAPRRCLPSLHTAAARVADTLRARCPRSPVTRDVARQVDALRQRLATASAAAL